MGHAALSKLELRTKSKIFDADNKDYLDNYKTPL